MQGSCVQCNKPLKVFESVIRGMGPVCAAKVLSDYEKEGIDDCIDLPFHPEHKDIICRRDPDGVKHFNIFQVFRHHSPSGFEWGYGGSGPADFALNIIELFMRERGFPQKVRIWDGNKITRETQMLYQDFKRSRLFGSLPHRGGTIKGDDIRTWITRRLVEIKSRPDYRP